MFHALSQKNQHTPNPLGEMKQKDATLSHQMYTFYMLLQLTSHVDFLGYMMQENHSVQVLDRDWWDDPYLGKDWCVGMNQRINGTRM